MKSLLVGPLVYSFSHQHILSPLMHKAVGNKKMKKTQTQPEFFIDLVRGHDHLVSQDMCLIF